MKTRDEDREAAMPLEPRSTLEEIVRQRQAVLNRRAEPQEVHDSDSDHDWEPEQEENGGDDEDVRSQAGTASEADDEEDPNPFLAPPKPRTAARTRPANRIESDDEDEEMQSVASSGEEVPKPRRGGDDDDDSEDGEPFDTSWLECVFNNAIRRGLRGIGLGLRLAYRVRLVRRRRPDRVGRKR